MNFCVDSKAIFESERLGCAEVVKKSEVFFTVARNVCRKRDGDYRLWARIAQIYEKRECMPYFLTNCSRF